MQRKHVVVYVWLDFVLLLHHAVAVSGCCILYFQGYRVVQETSTVGKGSVAITLASHCSGRRCQIEVR